MLTLAKEGKEKEKRPFRTAPLSQVKFIVRCTSYRAVASRQGLGSSLGKASHTKPLHALLPYTISPVCCTVTLAHPRIYLILSIHLLRGLSPLFHTLVYSETQFLLSYSHPFFISCNTILSCSHYIVLHSLTNAN